MKLRRVLRTIIVLLITAILAVLIIYRREQITEYAVKIAKKLTQDKIIIPEESYYHRDYDYISVSETNNFKPKNIEELKNVYYTVLNNGWNNFSFYCDIDYDNCKSDAQSLLDNEEYLSFLNNYVSPYNSYNKFHTVITGNDQITLNIEKLYSESEIKEIDAIIDKFIKDNNLSSEFVTKSDIKLIHDYLLENISYDEENAKRKDLVISNKANGALINKLALCSGYTDAFSIFMDKLNVPNFNVSTEDHVWNVIYFDGKWRHIDVTWDDDEINKNNNYNYYMINTDELLEKDTESHNFNQDLYLELK